MEDDQVPLVDSEISTTIDHHKEFVDENERENKTKQRKISNNNNINKRIPKKSLLKKKKGKVDQELLNLVEDNHSDDDEDQERDIIIDVEKTECKKGCCGDKKQDIKAINDIKQQQQDDQQQKPECKKGCCGDKKEESKPNQQQQEDQQQKPECKKGCCDDKKEIPKPVVNVDNCASKGCCNDKKPIKKGYCCEICIEDCCKSLCCKDECCVPYSLDLPSILNVNNASSSGNSGKKKKSVYASLIYKTCGLVGIKVGTANDYTEQEQDERLSIDLLDENDKKMLYLKVEGMTCADCVTTLEDKVKSLYGVSDITTSLFTEKSEIEYYSSVLSVNDIISTINTLGFIATEQSEPNSITLTLSTMLSNQNYNDENESSCFSQIKNINGVLKVKLQSEISQLVISYDSDIIGPRDLFNNCKRFDKYLDLSNEVNDKSKSKANPYYDLLVLSIILCIPIIIIAFILPSFNVIDEFLNHDIISKELTVRVLLLWVLSTPIQFIVGRPMYIQAYKTLVYARKCSMDLLIMISSSIAYFYSLLSLMIYHNDYSQDNVQVFFETSAILITLIILGRYLESLAKGHTTDVLNEMLHLQSQSAILITSQNNKQHQEEIDIKMVQLNDILLVKPYAKIPVDGIVIGKNSHPSIDESMITGESNPIQKKENDPVIGGSMNQSTSFKMLVNKPQSKSTLSSICKLIEEAQSKKPPFQSFADTIASVFVPSILCLGILVFIVWFLILYNGIVPVPQGKTVFTFSLSFAMAVLVISCPCAVSLSTPTAIMVGSGVAAKLGILFKGGDILESTHRLQTLVFDKTGTLTTGKMEISDFKVISSHYTPKEFFHFVASAESVSEHCIGISLIQYAKDVIHSVIQEPKSHKSIPGRGLEALVDNRSVLIGNQALFTDNNITISNEIQKQIIHQEELGKTVVIVSIDSEIVGIISFNDEIKKESKLVIEKLREQGIEVWMLSGDNEDSCKTISKRLGIENYRSKCSPKDKYDMILKLQQQSKDEKKKRVVGMIGDGINDSIALTQADVSISISSGTDLAIESSKLILMKDNLMDILIAIDLSKRVFKTIKLNLLWAFIYNCIGIPLACGLLYPIATIAIPPSLSGLSELLSSLPVVLFSLLLNNYSIPKL